MYPKLLGNPVVAWRDETTLQIGWGAHSLVVESAPAGLPQWLVRGAGGAWIVEARRSVLAALPLRRVAAPRAVEHSTLLPGAHRQCA